MKKRLSLLLAACMLAGLCACGGNETGQTSNGAQIEHPGSIVICASNSGNIWYSCAVKLSELLMREFPDMSVTVVEGGGDPNIDAVNLGTDAQLGFTSSTSLLPAAWWRPSMFWVTTALTFPSLSSLARAIWARFGFASGNSILFL